MRQKAHALQKVWDSGLGLSSWLSNLILEPEPENSALKSELRSVLARKNCSIVELGKSLCFLSKLTRTDVNYYEQAQGLALCPWLWEHFGPSYVATMLRAKLSPPIYASPPTISAVHALLTRHYQHPRCHC